MCIRDRAYRVTEMVAFALPSLLLLIGLLRYRWQWKIVFGFWILAALSNIHLMLLGVAIQNSNQKFSILVDIAYSGAAHSISIAAVVLAILVAIALDFWKNVRRDKIHWLGVAAWLVVLLLPRVAFLIASRYLPPRMLIGL